MRGETGGRAQTHLYCWMPNKAGDFTRDAQLARSLGARELLFWEADYIDNLSEPLRSEIAREMTAQEKCA